ncbi:MAG: PEP-CTERM sorting domain-containing protein [Planctomycetota bacterium]|nr:MAG: PEP-CTERM sorting domain-containing protein [Planctomycetota bacterium]
MGAVRRIGWIVILVLGVILVEDAGGVIVFDFEGAPVYGRAGEIEAYMEGVYGSDITVVGGTVRDALFGGWISGPLGDDNYVRAKGWCGPAEFSISFEEVPITSASFDSGVVFSSFYAYADGEEIFREGWRCWGSDNSGTIYFDSPVTTLRFSNRCFWGEIEMDNLSVTPVPEPATVLLVGLGGLILRMRRLK